MSLAVTPDCAALTVGGGGSGKTSPRRMVLAHLSTATADTARGQRVRGLLDELRDIDVDREMAGRFVERGGWVSELRREERDVWEHLYEALTTP